MNRAASKQQQAEATLADPRWQALVARDANADGHFYYAVITTGVYCLPSCAARRARPENVRFFDNREQAESAGFRPCARCRPDQTAPAHLTAIIEACRHMEQAETPPTLNQLAEQASLSPHHFHRVFKRILGVTPKSYASAIRARQLREGLQRDGRITDAIFDAGYNSSGRFYTQARALLGMEPARFRDGGNGERIEVALGQCSLGALLVARSGQGICAIALGDDADTLLRECQDHFPKADLRPGGDRFDALVARVAALMEHPEQEPDLPLDIRGTAFQQKVWQALRRVPAGETLSYAELARRIGSPKAVRAVAGACANNPLAVVIPCHRVVRSDGDVSGYRWGVERKRALLERETGAQEARS
ncbi:bifunctional DNA-binding transcriptional regulator/O6-methylguanine-DNA methyltransferase Ada [Alloalcanivorax xenomutans]|uniref:bifunctional DNA-binding transcriptional regulator/O6-methylguanine-DNA methyltransferase Ada n=1 Tax=Alloalcanivorax xenomutans TaxID=1094342 RepID=UPI003D9B99D4